MENVPTKLSNFKSKVDKLESDKLVPFPVDLCKLTNAVKNDVKKDVYNAKIKDIKDKIPDITSLATNATLNAKINEVKNEVPSITNLGGTVARNAKINEVKSNISKTTSALTPVENKMPGHSKSITTPKFNKLTAENFVARLAQTNLTSKNDIFNFWKKTDFDNKTKTFNKKINSNKTNNLLVKKELNELLENVKQYQQKD